MPEHLTSANGTTKHVFKITPHPTIVGAPTTGEGALGEVFVDSLGHRYDCVVAGSPGVWRRSFDSDSMISHKRDRQDQKPPIGAALVFDRFGNVVRLA